MRLHLSDHAVLRFQERVRPGLEFVAARHEMFRLAFNNGERVERPAWAPELETAEQFYVSLGADVLLVCIPMRKGYPRCVTVLTRGSIPKATRARRNANRRKRPSRGAIKLADKSRPSRRGDWVPSAEVYSEVPHHGDDGAGEALGQVPARDEGRADPGAQRARAA